MDWKESFNHCDVTGCRVKALHFIDVGKPYKRQLCDHHFLQEQKYPILQSIRIYFSCGGWFGYRRSYLLLHPWKLIEEISYEIKWAYQRVFRGWDDRVIWSIDFYLARNMIQWLQVLKKKRTGISLDFLPEKDYANGEEWTEEEEQDAIKKFNNVLDEISAGFQAYLDAGDLEYTDREDFFAERSRLDEKFKKGMELFVKHYHNLND